VTYKLFEYLAAGLPVVCSLDGEMGEMIRREEVGVSYRAGDAADLARVLGRLAADREELARMATRARRLAEASGDARRVYGRWRSSSSRWRGRGRGSRRMIEERGQPDNLRGLAKRGMAWAAFGQGGTVALHYLIMLVLAWRLAPRSSAGRPRHESSCSRSTRSRSSAWVRRSSSAVTSPRGTSPRSSG